MIRANLTVRLTSRAGM